MVMKTIKISEELHTKIKKFCDSENLKLNKWCEDALSGELLYAKEYAGLRNRRKSEDKKVS